MSNIQIVKLTTGEDLMGEVTSTEVDGKEGFITIDNPAIIMMMPKPGSDTDFGVGLAPYAPFSKDHKVPIFPNHVVSVYFPGNDILKAYNEKFNPSAIIKPDFINKKILTETNKGK